MPELSAEKARATIRAVEAAVEAWLDRRMRSEYFKDVLLEHHDTFLKIAHAYAEMKEREAEVEADERAIDRLVGAIFPTDEGERP